MAFLLLQLCIEVRTVANAFLLPKALLFWWQGSDALVTAYGIRHGFGLLGSLLSGFHEVCGLNGISSGLRCVGGLFGCFDNLGSVLNGSVQRAFSEFQAECRKQRGGMITSS